MAERRMFAKSIINSDAFTDMPLSTQALYFHLGMAADDDGFVNNAKQIKKMIGAADDDLKILNLKHFVIPFQSGVIVITHWLAHNQIRKDRYKPTRFAEEKGMLALNINKEYVLENNPDVLLVEDGKPLGNQVETQCSIGKVSIDKYSIDECKYQLGKEEITKAQYDTLMKIFGKDIVDKVINRIL